MPLYEYRCTECETEFEVIQKVSDDPLTECRSCSGSVRKLISQSAFQFKGSGWYVTDYARKGSQAESTSSSDKGSEGKKDAAAKSSSEDSSSTTKPKAAKPSTSESSS